jgi:type I restriction enzyme, S subunit
MNEQAKTAWAKIPLGKLAKKLVNGGTPPTEVARFWNGKTPWVTGADFNSSGIGEFRRFVSEEAISQTATNMIERGQLLIVTRTGVGKLAIAPCNIAISQDITGFYVDEGQATPEFLYHRMRRGVEDLKKLNQGTSINGIIRADLENYPVELPPLPEQRRIAEILGTVDAAIEQTEALVAKYQQLKAGLMHDLFTRGLSPEASAQGDVTWKLRPTRQAAPHLYHQSPLGWIPKEWEVKPLGVLAEIVSGVTLGCKAEIDDEVGVPYLRVANVQDGYFDLTEVKSVTVSRAKFEKLQLRRGDVLMNEGGDFDKLGRGSVWQEEIKPCIHQNHVFRVRPEPEQLRSYYLAYWSQSESGKKFFLLNSKQSTNLASINSTQLNRFPIALPSTQEQERIELRIAALQSRIEMESREVTKLRAQKQGLMQDLLTGRVRVETSNH